MTAYKLNIGATIEAASEQEACEIYAARAGYKSAAEFAEHIRPLSVTEVIRKEEFTFAELLATYNA